jgi:hypothetical protein
MRWVAQGKVVGAGSISPMALRPAKSPGRSSTRVTQATAFAAKLSPSRAHSINQTISIFKRFRTCDLPASRARLRAGRVNRIYRAETEIGKWAEGTPRFRKPGMQIVAQFPRAQKSLADYYKDRFKKPDETADAMAQQASDIVFRSYFTRP